MENFNLINKEKIEQYKKEVSAENIYFIDPEIYKENLKTHYKLLDDKDRLLRFNYKINDLGIDHYVDFLINKKAILIGYIINHEIVGLSEIIAQSNNTAEIAITVVKKHRKKHVGKNLLINTVFVAEKKSYKNIKIDFSRNNKIVYSWTKGFHIKISSVFDECFTIFPVVPGNTSKINKLNHKE